MWALINLYQPVCTFFVVFTVKIVSGFGENANKKDLEPDLWKTLPQNSGILFWKVESIDGLGVGWRPMSFGNCFICLYLF